MSRRQEGRAPRGVQKFRPPTIPPPTPLSRRAPTLQPWHDFFLLTGTAAASLLGLVFVAGSIAASIPNEKLGDNSTRALWVLPIVYAFIRVLVVSAIGVVPGQRPLTFGWLLVGLSGVDLARMAVVFWGMLHQHRNREPLETSDWGWYLLYPGAATLLVGVSGVLVTIGHDLPPLLLAVGLIGHLVMGVHNAWSLVDWPSTW